MKTNRLITIAGFVLLLVLIVVLMFRLNSLTSKYDALADKINHLSHQEVPETTQDPSVPEGSEPEITEGTQVTDPEILPEKKETVYALGISIDEEKETVTVQDDDNRLLSDLTSATDAANGTYTVSYTQDGKDMLLVKVSKESANYKGKRLYVYQIETTTALAQFAHSQPQYQWEYRTDPEGAYSLLQSNPEEGVEVYESGKLVLPQAYLDQLTSASGELQLRCVAEISTETAVIPQPIPEPDAEGTIFGDKEDAETIPEDTVQAFTQVITNPDEPVSNIPVPEEKAEKLVITMEGFSHAITMTEIHTQEQENEQ